MRGEKRRLGFDTEFETHTAQNRHQGETKEKTMTKKKEDGQRREKRRIKRKKRKVKSGERGESTTLNRTKRRGDEAKRGRVPSGEGGGDVGKRGFYADDGRQREEEAVSERSVVSEEALQSIDTSIFGQRKRNIEKRIKSKRYTKYDIRAGESVYNNDNEPRKEDVDAKKEQSAIRK